MVDIRGDVVDDIIDDIIDDIMAVVLLPLPPAGAYGECFPGTGGERGRETWLTWGREREIVNMWVRERQLT